MCYRRLGKALIVFGVLIFPVNFTLGFEGVFKLPCLISYHNKVPFIVNCTVTININTEHVVEMARTPNGKAFIIENDKLDTGKWYLNHEVAIMTLYQPETCYRNAEVKLCL